jgi:hypothetical protein
VLDARSLQFASAPSRLQPINWIQLAQSDATNRLGRACRGARWRVRWRARRQWLTSPCCGGGDSATPPARQRGRSARHAAMYGHLSRHFTSGGWAALRRTAGTAGRRRTSATAPSCRSASPAPVYPPALCRRAVARLHACISPRFDPDPHTSQPTLSWGMAFCPRLTLSIWPFLARGVEAAREPRRWEGCGSAPFFCPPPPSPILPPLSQLSSPPLPRNFSPENSNVPGQYVVRRGVKGRRAEEPEEWSRKRARRLFVEGEIMGIWEPGCWQKGERESRVGRSGAGL